MFCFIALMIFGILGIFSAANRRLAKEAAKCVFRHMTLRPCNTTFRDKVKGKILNWLLERSPFSAKIFNRYFEAISWVLFILMMGSFGYTIYGAYNFYMYGSCNGPNSGAFCIFDPAGGSNRVTESAKCYLEKPTAKNLDFSKLDLKLFPQRLNGASNNNIIFIGCYACDYTRKAYPIIKNLLSKYRSNFTFAHFPTRSETTYLLNYDYCVYRESPEKFWQYNSSLFNLAPSSLKNSSAVDNLLKELGVDASRIQKCANDGESKAATGKWMEQLNDVGIYGTPTIWINGKIFVGPKPERVYKRAFHNS